MDLISSEKVQPQQQLTCGSLVKQPLPFSLTDALRVMTQSGELQGLIGLCYSEFARNWLTFLAEATFKARAGVVVRCPDERVRDFCHLPFEVN